MSRSRVAVALTVIGFALLAAGVAVIFWPAALVLAGALLLAAGLFGVDMG